MRPTPFLTRTVRPARAVTSTVPARPAAWAGAARAGVRRAKAGAGEERPEEEFGGRGDARARAACEGRHGDPLDGPGFKALRGSARGCAPSRQQGKLAKAKLIQKVGSVLIWNCSQLRPLRTLRRDACGCEIRPGRIRADERQPQVPGAGAPPAGSRPSPRRVRRPGRRDPGGPVAVYVSGVCRPPTLPSRATVLRCVMPPRPATPLARDPERGRACPPRGRCSEPAHPASRAAR